MSERLPSCYGLMMCRSPYKLAGKQRLPESFSFAGTWLRCVLASQKLTSVRFSFAETHFVRFSFAETHFVRFSFAETHFVRFSFAETHFVRFQVAFIGSNRFYSMLSNPVTSSPKPVRPVREEGWPSTRIFFTWRLARICAPIP